MYTDQNNGIVMNDDGNIKPANNGKWQSMLMMLYMPGSEIPLLYCRAAEIRHTTGRVWSATPRGGAAGMTGVSGEERMNASMGEVCGWKIVMVTIE